MGKSETKDETFSPASAPDPVKSQAYEPPAVAWEEVFDPVAATASECRDNPTLPGCF